MLRRAFVNNLFILRKKFKNTSNKTHILTHDKKGL